MIELTVWRAGSKDDAPGRWLCESGMLHLLSRMALTLELMGSGAAAAEWDVRAFNVPDCGRFGCSL
jgi:hypothetical protein